MSRSIPSVINDNSFCRSPDEVCIQGRIQEGARPGVATEVVPYGTEREQIYSPYQWRAPGSNRGPAGMLQCP